MDTFIEVCNIKIPGSRQNRYRILTPFIFDDGDHLSIFMKTLPEGGYFTDEGHTYMHLNYDMDVKDLEKGTGKKLLMLPCQGLE